MVKNILILMCSLFIVGCGTAPTKIYTDVKDRDVEVLYCPAPPVIKRPDLPIKHMTKEQLAQDGEVVKHWKATVQTLIGYSEELEKAIEIQRVINTEYETKKKELENTKASPTKIKE